MANGSSAFEIKKQFSSGCMRVEIKFNSSFSGFVPVAEFDFKASPDYSFVSGMFYSCKSGFDLDKKLRLSFPYTSYYKFRIPAIKRGGKFWKSLIYAKLPIAAFQAGSKLFAVEFEPVARSSKGKEVVPFVAAESKNGKIRLSFSVFGKFPMIRKDRIWMGIGKRGFFDYRFAKGEKIRLCFRVHEISGNWKDFVLDYFRKKTRGEKSSSKLVKKNISCLKQALWRAWNDRLGAFAQLPWKKVPGFALEELAWGLTSYEAVNMAYFHDYFTKSRDSDYEYWAQRLEKIFTNPKIMAKPKCGKGIIWHELTGISGKEVFGASYLYTGYAGYPGGQATIAFNLMRYSNSAKRKSLLNLAKSSLEYIVSTQNKDGSWPAAIRQLPEAPMRSADYEKLKTTGGSAECVRALLLGWKIFKIVKFRNSALRGLKFLEPGAGNACIGVNVLRDIGKDEVEGLSAVYAVNAFLDAYEDIGNKKYLNLALVWASHMLTWFYMWESKNLKLRGFFHPISQSITPRISPYESVLAVSVCARLFEKTKDALWKNLALMEYRKISDYIEKDGGLCECYFPDWLSGLDTLPMEQTFATVELLNASVSLAEMEKLSIMLRRARAKVGKGKRHDFSRSSECIEVFEKGKTVLKFDFKNFRIWLKGRRAELSFFNPYSKRSMLKASLRGRFSPGSSLSNAAEEIRSVISGMKGHENQDSMNLCLFSKQKKIRWGAEIISAHPLAIRFFTESALHRIDGVAKINSKSGKIRISFEPLEIRVLGCGLSCSQVIFPVAEKGIKVDEKFDRVLKKGSIAGYDISLQSNWTHHGLFRQNIALEA